ncbi:OmpP1/FadL family transporter [Dyella flagellata]|uniref:Membrane protein n=1 Tax=Dyella flagellata TaxID=1867833 RepID=A0ABQ5X4Z7_9GAMM|nr:outer membrane protein transport protein [Dyella flagellata]GLQ86643.1 membrane protein [Dyella flagellata]
MHTFFRNSVRGGRPYALAALGLAIAGALAMPQQAHASSFQLKEDTAQAMGRAYAGSATAGGDVSVVANAPAAMSDLKGTYFEADVTAINFSAQFSGSAHDVLGNPISGGNGGDAGTTMPLPSFFFATQLTDRLHVGASITVPFGFKTTYDNDWVGRYNSVYSKFESLDGTMSASFDVTDNLSIGASAIAQRTSATLTNAINFSSVALGLAGPGTALNLPVNQVYALVPPGSDGLARISGASWAWGWQAGAYWKVTSQDKLSFNYRSKITHRLQGTANFNVPDNVSALVGQLAPALGLTPATLPFQHTTGTALFTTPSTATVSYWHQEQQFGFGADVAWTGWDVFKNLTVNYGNPTQPTTTQMFNWHNSWYFSVGGDYYLTDKLTLRGGFGYDTTPTTAAFREPRVPDETRKLVSAGVGYKATDHFSINASYAHIFVNRASINGAVSPTGDVLSGSFDDAGNLFALSAIYKF